MNKKFYVYALTDPRRGKKGAVFYIGKGTWQKKKSKERNQDHLKTAISGRHCNPKLQNKIKKIVKAGFVYGVDFLFSTDNEDECFAMEVYWIAFYGRKSLCNGTDGGEGGSGRIISEETRAKLSESHKGKKASEETRAKMRERVTSPETSAKISAAGKRREPATAETRTKMSAAAKAREDNKRANGWTYPEEGRIKLRDKRPSEETRSKMSASHIGRVPWNKGKETPPEVIAKIIASCTPEARAKMSARSKGNKNALGSIRSKETRAKISTATKGRTAHNKGKTMPQEQKTKLSVAVNTYYANKRADKLEAMAA